MSDTLEKRITDWVEFKKNVEWSETVHLEPSEIIELINNETKVLIEQMEVDKQKLVDVCFSVSAAIVDKEFKLIDKDTNYICTWVAKQLKIMGFETKPKGASWGVLVKK